MIKSLCVCAGGRVRSVAARFILTDVYGHDALSCGIDKNSLFTLSTLFNWADIIWVLDTEVLAFIKRNWGEAAIAKIKLINVGPDQWGSESNKTLRLYVVEKIKEHEGYSV